VIVRRPTTRDAAAIRSLQAHLSHPNPTLVAPAVDGFARCRVAVASGRVTGYAVALPGRPTLVLELAVAPGRRRQGHGRALLASVAGDADRVEASTPADNDDAIRFYRTQGFAEADRRPGFYADGTDALRLVRGE
jgi:ribosomal-protein-alanine N-acetyltransferase